MNAAGQFVPDLFDRIASVAMQWCFGFQRQRFTIASACIANRWNIERASSMSVFFLPQTSARKRT
jgi:hypothetical protein